MLTHGILVVEEWKNLIDQIRFTITVPIDEPREVWKTR